MAVTAASIVVKDVVKLLNAGAFAGPEDMALAIVKHVHDTMAAKKGFALANRHLGFDFVWGPYATENEAKKDLPLLTGGQALIFPLLSVTALRSRSVSDYTPNNSCHGCRHPEVAHWKGGTCASMKCQCTHYLDSPQLKLVA